MEAADFPVYAYTALGHVHKPQRVGGRPDVQYSGGLERLAIDEAGQPRGVVLLDVAEDGLVGEPTFVELPACPFYRVEIDGQDGMAGLADRYPEPERAYVEVTLRYKAGLDNSAEMESEVRRVFPRCYHVSRRPEGTDLRRVEGALSPHDPASTARDYVARAIADDAQRSRVLALLDRIMPEVLG